MPRRMILAAVGITIPVCVLAARPITPNARRTVSTVFWDEAWPSDTTGSLEGTVLFAQAHVVPSKHGIEGDTQGHLTALRPALVMLKPKAGVVDEGYEVVLKAKAGQEVLGEMPMAHPNDVPKTAEWMPLPEDFAIPSWPLGELDGAVTVDLSNKDVRQALEGTPDANPDRAYITDLLVAQKVTKVSMTVANVYQRVHDLYLPDAMQLSDGVILQMTTVGTTTFWFTRNGATTSVATGTKGEAFHITVVHGMWVGQGETFTHSNYVFGRFWTAEIPQEWVVPGVAFEFAQDQVVGVLEGVHVGGASELLMHVIDTGFLTAPRGVFDFRDDFAAGREFYETLPVSRFVQAQYATVHWEEIMLPDGTFYAVGAASNDEGTVYKGDLRNTIGKTLVASGIDMANYGIFSSTAEDSKTHPYTCAQLTAHHTVGLYQNGVVVHGLSGGNGIVTLKGSYGNEMSHEGGHNFGLGHYIEGPRGSIHRPAGEMGSTWGWDAHTNLFIPNFEPESSGEDVCCCPDKNDVCVGPYLGKYRYRKDSQAGGGAGRWGNNRYTLYHPNSMHRMQNNYWENKAVFASDAATGFRRWNPAGGNMAEMNGPGVGAPTLYRVPVTTLVGYYDPENTMAAKSYVYPPLYGAYGFVYDGSAAPASTGCELRVTIATGAIRYFVLHGERYAEGKAVMNKFHVNVASADEVKSAAVYCNGAKLAERGAFPIPPPLEYAVHGASFQPPSYTMAPGCAVPGETRMVFNLAMGSDLLGGEDKVAVIPAAAECADVETLCAKGGACSWKDGAVSVGAGALIWTAGELPTLAAESDYALCFLSARHPLWQRLAATFRTCRPTPAPPTPTPPTALPPTPLPPDATPAPPTPVPTTATPTPTPVPPTPAPPTPAPTLVTWPPGPSATPEPIEEEEEYWQTPAPAEGDRNGTAAPDGIPGNTTVVPAPTPTPPLDSSAAGSDGADSGFPWWAVLTVFAVVVAAAAGVWLLRRLRRGRKEDAVGDGGESAGAREMQAPCEFSPTVSLGDFNPMKINTVATTKSLLAPPSSSHVTNKHSLSFGASLSAGSASALSPPRRTPSAGGSSALLSDATPPTSPPAPAGTEFAML